MRQIKINFLERESPTLTSTPYVTTRKVAEIIG